MSRQAHNERGRGLRLRVTALFLSGAFFISSFGAVPASGAESEAVEVPIDIDAVAAADTISMSFDGALLKDVLLLFSQQSGLNFVATQEVEAKKVTVYFENVTPKDALDSIITANGLAYSKKPGSDIYMVYPAAKAQAAELITKVIRLKHMRLSTSPLDVGGQVTVSNLQNSAGSVAPGASSSSTSASTTSSSSTSTRGADNLVKNLLSAQGKLTVDLQTNSIIITDTKESIAAIEKVLAEIDVPPSQVLLEVYIMEVSKNLASDIGIDWGGSSGALGTLTGGSRTTQIPFKSLRQAELVVNPLGDDGSFSGEAGDASAPSQVSFGTIDATNFTATLRAIETNTMTKILARPRVLTQNNEAAEIKLVTNAAIGTTTTATSDTGSTSETTERAEVGVAMRMTPQINDDDTVSLFLEPSVSTLADSQVVPEKADVTSRLVRTMARVNDNQTLVIGGLIDSQGTSSKRKLPFLGDLPVIGKAFRYDLERDFDREILVFITPHIVRGVSSLGMHSATAQGQDVAVRRMLDQFMDKEMNSVDEPFQGFEKTKQRFFTQEEELVRDAELKYSNPVVEKQMTQALDALSPQMVERKMSQSMDSLNPKK